jgi:hypothetical protein
VCIWFDPTSTTSVFTFDDSSRRDGGQK